jgi:ATP-binding cassette, subfamily B, bacterial
MSDQHIDPTTGQPSVDPFGGALSPGGGDGAADADAQIAGVQPDAFAPESWRTWRTKGAWRGWRKMPRVFPYLRKYRKLYVIVILLTLVASVTALAQPWPLAVMIDSVLPKNPHPPAAFLSAIFGDHPNRYHLLIFVVAAGFLITIVGHGLDVINNYVSAKVEQNMILDLRADLFDHCERLSLTFHDERLTGQLMSLINLQAASVGMVAMAFPPMIQNLLTLIGMLTIAILIDWQVTLISLVAVPMIYYATGLYGTRIVPRIRQVMGLEWRSLSIVFEAMSMLRVIVSFGREKYEWRRFRDQGQTAVDARVKLTVRQTLFSLGVTAATATGTALVLGFGAWHVLQGKITPGELLVLISYIAAIYQPLEQLGNQIGHLHQAFVFLDAALSLLEDEPEVVEPDDAVDLGRARGELTMENVSFAYQNRVDTLKNISFHVQAGERVAIVGPTGAGKTTLTNLLVRFYDPKEGAIKVDGVDIKQATLQSLRENISLVLQQPLLFSGTIAENIRYGKLDATRDEIVASAKAANAHDFITGMPDGYDTVLGEGGQQLSGGERQRICVARAFIKDAPILILDEPTSSIDSKTENVILDALDDLMVGRTSFMIAHRLSTIHDADRILVMNHGELVEQGTNDELVARGGLYAQLYQAQTRQKRRRGVDGGEPPAPAAPAAPPAPAPVADGPPPEVRERVAAAIASTHGGAPATPPGVTPPNAPPGEPAVPGAKPPPGNGVGNGRRRGVVKIVTRPDVHCDVCGRFLIRGESVATFLAPPSGKRREPAMGDQANMGPFLTDFRAMGQTDSKCVCELCMPIAHDLGWTALPAVGGSQ